MKKENIAAVLAAGIGVLAIAWYLTKKKPATAPGAGGPSANAGGAIPRPAGRSAFGGSQGSIPNIIASAAALTSASRAINVPIDTTTSQITEAPMYLPQIQDNVGNLIDDGANPAGFQGTQLVSSESLGTVQLPGLGDFGPDVAGNVSALDVGGTDFGTVYA